MSWSLIWAALTVLLAGPLLAWVLVSVGVVVAIIILGLERNGPWWDNVILVILGILLCGLSSLFLSTVWLAVSLFLWAAVAWLGCLTLPERQKLSGWALAGAIIAAVGLLIRLVESEKRELLAGSLGLMAAGLLFSLFTQLEDEFKPSSRSDTCALLIRGVSTGLVSLHLFLLGQIAWRAMF